jgi:cobyrinic acid a,c-diamide synthase
VDLRHHGDVEAGPGLLDFAVNVYPGPRPAWLEAALLDGIAASSAYPDVAPARAALAARHGRATDEVLPTAGAAEACTLVARLRPWRRPVVVHPQFTEPHAALEAAGHRVTVALCRAEDGFRLDPAAVPGDADLVVVGNPTNPTGVLHPAAAIRSLVRPGRLVVVDEAFLDAVPGEPEALAGEPGVLVLRSLTKHWSIPGIRAGYAIGEPAVIAGLRALQTPWSVSSPAIAAMVAIAGETEESARRARELTAWREHLEKGLRNRCVAFPGSAPFVLAWAGVGVHAALRRQGVAVRRGGTFPGLDDSWIRIAARPPAQVNLLLATLDIVRAGPRA